MQTAACLASVEEALQKEHGRIAKALGLRESWKRLSDDEAAAILRDSVPTSVQECGKWTGREPLLDAWGNRVVVDIRASPADFRVWSAGPDGQFGTDDDLSGHGPGAMTDGGRP